MMGFVKAVIFTCKPLSLVFSFRLDKENSEVWWVIEGNAGGELYYKGMGLDLSIALYPKTHIRINERQLHTNHCGYLGALDRRTSIRYAL